MTTHVPRRSRPARVRFLLAGLAAALPAALAGCSDETPTVARPSPPLVAPSGGGFGGQALTRIAPEDRKAAPIAAGPALVGDGTVTTAHPGKVVVINVWGSWCGPCRVEAPDLAEASTATADDAVFIGINIRDATPAPAQAFVRAFKVPYAHIYDPDAQQLLRFSSVLPPNGIPTTLIIDREGRVAARIVGVVSKTSLIQLIDDTKNGR